MPLPSSFKSARGLVSFPLAFRTVPTFVTAHLFCTSREKRHTLMLCILLLFRIIINYVKKNAWLPPIFFLDLNSPCYKICFSRIITGGGGGGHSSEFLVGVCHLVPQIQTKIFHFPHLFSDQASKIHTRFQTFVVP